LAAIGIGAAVGALVGGTLNAAAQADGGHAFDVGSFLMATGIGAVAGAVVGANISLGGVGAMKFIFAYESIGHAALGWTAVAGFTVPVGAVAGATVAGHQGKDALGTLEWAGRGSEGGLLAAAGGALGHLAVAGAAGVVGGSSWIPLVAAANGGINGAFAGTRGIYDWGGWGSLAFVADSTWGIFGTSLGNLVNIGNTVGGAEYSERLSRRQNRQVFLDGFSPGPEFGFSERFSGLAA
jgi:hypothetical protein